MNKKANQLSDSPEGKEMNKFIKNLNSILENVIAVKKVVKLVVEKDSFIRCPSGKIALIYFCSIFQILLFKDT